MGRSKFIEGSNDEILQDSPNTYKFAKFLIQFQAVSATREENRYTLHNHHVKMFLFDLHRPFYFM